METKRHLLLSFNFVTGTFAVEVMETHRSHRHKPHPVTGTFAVEVMETQTDKLVLLLR